MFSTIFGNLAVNICYGRKHPQNWMMYGGEGSKCPQVFPSSDNFLFSLQKYLLDDIFNSAVSGLNGAEIVFTPCATTGRINESTWGIEVRIFYLLSFFFVCLKQLLLDIFEEEKS